MQITHVEVTPVELQLREAVRIARAAEIRQVTVIFVRVETRQGQNAWGCSVAHPALTRQEPETVLRACQACAAEAIGLPPLNLEYALAALAEAAGPVLAALGAFDLAFHDLLGLAAGQPLYRLLGGYRSRIQTSVTIPLGAVEESVGIARARARLGFRILKIKGGVNPEDDVHRVRAIRRALPELALRLDADGGYSVQDALDVARALRGEIEMLEQPTLPEDFQGLAQVSSQSPVPILADQSVSGPASALELVARRAVQGVSVKLAACGGLHCAQQIDAIVRAARLSTMVSCVIEPALMTAAGLSFALSSPNVHYGDLDGYLSLAQDPTQAGFHLEDGWLYASEVPGLGCTVNLG